MATLNPFDLLGDDDSEDPAQFIVAAQQKVQSSVPKKGPASDQPPSKNTAPAKLPSKPLPPSQAVRDSRNEGQRGGRGGGRGDGRGRGRGRGRVFPRDSSDNENAFSNNNGYLEGYRASDDGDAGRSGERRGFRGGFRRHGGFGNGEDADGERPPRRTFDRRSGTGRGNEIKRDGSGRGNWGTTTDEVAPESEEPVPEGEKIVENEKQTGPEVAETKDSPVNETEEKEVEPEEKEMTLEEYQKLLEEKRKGLLELKSEERKVKVDKEFESMQLLANKKNDDDVFIKLGSDKDKRKEAAEKAKKSVSINEFLKPADGENYYRPGGRGRGRGRGRGGYGSNVSNVEAAPKIEDVGQFPSLGSK